jgi:hypothetical protein
LGGADRYKGLSSVTFVRGFVEEAYLSGNGWLDFADLLVGAHPIREVWLSSWPEPSQARFRRLARYGGWLWVDAIRAAWPEVVFHYPLCGNVGRVVEPVASDWSDGFGLGRPRRQRQRKAAAR